MKLFFLNVWFWIKVVLACIAIPVIILLGAATILVLYVVSLIVAVITTLVKDTISYWAPVCVSIGLVYSFIKKALTKPGDLL